MRRRYLIQSMLASGVACLCSAPSAARDLRQKLVRAPTSVGKTKRVQIDGSRAYAFQLGPDKFESGGGFRQREELRDLLTLAKGAVRYSIEFLFPEIDDPDGYLERPFIFFQIKPKDPRTSEGDWFPYLSIQLERNYLKDGLYTDFEFEVGDIRSAQSNQPIRQNVWYRLDVVVKWSNGTDGYALVSVDGGRIASFRGRTGPDGVPLVNFGIYRSYMHLANPEKVETLKFFVRNYVVTQLDV